jgi:exopolysaccharide biosynthesis protein
VSKDSDKGSEKKEPIRWIRTILIDFSCLSLLALAYFNFMASNSPTGRQVIHYENIVVTAIADLAKVLSSPSAVENREREQAKQEAEKEAVKSRQTHPDIFNPEKPLGTPEIALAPLPPPITLPKPPMPVKPLWESKPKAKPKVVKVAKPIQFSKRKLNGVGFYQATIDLTDPQTYIAVGLANRALMANTQQVTHGDENFVSMLKRYPGAVVVNGTFFAKDDHKCVMGNMRSGGRYLKYSQWEHFGTTLGLKKGNVPEMVTADDIGSKPAWDEHWFSLTCGPRLLKDGEVWLNPALEGFSDDHVLGIGPRSAIGFPASRDKIYLISFLNGLSLDAEAKMMKAIGCSEAMNLDGGASKALAYNGSIILTPGRNLTNVLVVYDNRHPAPPELVQSWNDFNGIATASAIPDANTAVSIHSLQRTK